MAHSASIPLKLVAATLIGTLPVSALAQAQQARMEIQRQFCANIKQVQSLAAQGFRTIDRGHYQGSSSADIHATSLELRDAFECFISTHAGKQPSYMCSWHLHEQTAPAQFRGMGNLIAHCLAVRPDWSLMDDTEMLQLDMDSGPTHVSLIGEQGDMSLVIGLAEKKAAH
jgi:hypothetical protein